MKYLPLIWSNLSRKPLRTFLMMMSLTAGFLLFGILDGVDSAFAAAVERMRLDRLIMEPRFREPPLPLSYRDRVLRVPGVTDMTWTVFLQTSYRDPKDAVVFAASEPRSFFRVRDEFKASPGAIDALVRTRMGVVLLESLAMAHGWKVGDRLTLQAPQSRRDGDANWSFEVVGLMNNPSNPGQFGFGLINYDYLDDLRLAGAGTIGRFVVKIDNPARAAQISRSIDALFANSSAPTRTKSENESARTQLAIVGDIGIVIRGVIGAVFLALLFLTGNTVLQSMRERTSEIGVMKTLGFPDVAVMALVLGETLLVCVIPAVAGVALAAMFFPQAGKYIPDMAAYLPPAPMSVTVFGSALVAAATLALLSGAIPAWRAMRLRVTDALASK